MGLIQTAGQLRFSFQAIIVGSKRILGDSDSDKSSIKKQNSHLMRMLGVPDDSSTSDFDDQFELKDSYSFKNNHDNDLDDDDDDDDDDFEFMFRNSPPKRKKLKGRTRGGFQELFE